MDIDPSSLFIRDFPDPILRRRADPVPDIDDTVRAVAQRMIDLMVEAEGIGLAAPQIGLALRLFVAHVPPLLEDGRAPGDEPETCQTEPEVFLNPSLRDFGGELIPFEEGCLSLPEIRGEVRRPDEVTLDATTLDGHPVTRRASSLLARCWQHEVDHLDGVLIIDRMTPMARLKNRAKIRDLERQAAETR